MRILSKYIGYIYTILWMLYYLQEDLRISGLIAQLILVILMLMSFYIFLQLNVCFKMSSYLKWLSIMLLILSIYGVIPIIGGESFHKHGYVSNVTFNYFYLQKLYISILPIYAFYYFTIKKMITSKNLIYIFGIILICCIFMFYQNNQINSAQHSKDEITNNIGYYFVPLIPMLYIIKMKEVWKFFILAVIFFYVMISMKRGAILVGSIAFISFVIYQLKKVTKKQVAYILGLSSIVLYAAYKFIMNLYETSPYFRIRLDRTLQGDSSGRDHIYQNYLYYFIDKSTLMEFLFGHGAAGTVSTFGQWAHNDWLEFAIDQGVFGVMLYLVYWILFIYEWYYYQGERRERCALRDCLILYFLVALFSMSINNMAIAGSLCIGYCLAMNRRNKYNIGYAH